MIAEASAAPPGTFSGKMYLRIDCCHVRPLLHDLMASIHNIEIISVCMDKFILKISLSIRRAAAEGKKCTYELIVIEREEIEQG